MSLLHHSTPTSISQLFGFSSSASPEPSERVGNGGSEKSDAKVSEGGDTQAADQTKESGSIPDSQSANVRRQRNLRGGTKRTAFSDSDSDEDLSTEDLVKLLTEKEELLKQKHKEVEKMQDKVLRTYAEMENVMDRTRREAENTKKFSIQVHVLFWHTFCAFKSKSLRLYLPHSCRTISIHRSNNHKIINK